MNIRNWLIHLLGGVTKQQLVEAATEQYQLGEGMGIIQGRKDCKVAWKILPLPFSDAQLAGVEYGTFVTPVGFGTEFGECNIPAPSPNGYEQRAMYVSKSSLEAHGIIDLVCHNPVKFGGHDAAMSSALVPVILTVLR